MSGLADAAGGFPAEPPVPDLDLVEYVVISLPRLSATGTVAQALKQLVDAERIRILDLVGIEVAPDGSCQVVEPELLAGLGTVDAEVGGLLSDDDIALAGQALQAGTAALIVVAEDRWAQQLADAARGGGGRIVGGERIPRHRLEQSRRSLERLDGNGGG